MIKLASGTRPIRSATSRIVNANHGIMSSAIKLRVANRVIRLGVPQPTEWQGFGNQIDAAFVFARAYLVNVHDPFPAHGTHAREPMNVSDSFSQCCTPLLS